MSANDPERTLANIRLSTPAEQAASRSPRSLAGLRRRRRFSAVWVLVRVPTFHRFISLRTRRSVRALLQRQGRKGNAMQLAKVLATILMRWCRKLDRPMIAATDRLSCNEILAEPNALRRHWLGSVMVITLGGE
jgi:hypothetical protein